MVRLRRIQEACCFTAPENQSQGEFDEEDFHVEIARCVIRLMVVKKSEGAGDRIIRFLGLFLHHATEKGKGYACLSFNYGVNREQMQRLLLEMMATKPKLFRKLQVRD